MLLVYSLGAITQELLPLWTGGKTLISNQMPLFDLIISQMASMFNLGHANIVCTNPTNWAWFDGIHEETYLENN